LPGFTARAFFCFHDFLATNQTRVYSQSKYHAKGWERQRGSRDPVFVAISRAPLMTFNAIELIGGAYSALFYFPPHW
jgi:hypothetical protein